MYLRDTFNVIRSTNVSDGIGGFTESMSLHRHNIKGYVRQLTGEESVIYGQKSQNNMYRLYCSDIDVTISDVITILRYGDDIVGAYEVEAIDQRRELGTGHKKNMQIDLYKKGKSLTQILVPAPVSATFTVATSIVEIVFSLPLDETIGITTDPSFGISNFVHRFTNEVFAVDNVVTGHVTNSGLPTPADRVIYIGTSSSLKGVTGGETESFIIPLTVV